MNEKHLDNLLLQMESEVNALKIAHERGLGLIDFYTHEVSIPALAGSGSYSSYAILTIELTPESGEQTPFYIAPKESRFSGVHFDSSGRAIITYGANNHDDIPATTTTFMTSSKIASSTARWTA